uniref:Homologous recombination factor with OB-fold n=1 Tax=Catharus ustulatus TaxID=91951 RepID=A0A8C3UZ14_CATUS
IAPQIVVSLPVPFFPFFPQSCHLQKLFGTDGELEDEDFLSAVEDAENQFVMPGHSSASVVPVPPSKTRPSEPHPSEPHPSKAHPSEPHPSKSHPSTAHPSESHPSEPHPSTAHPSKAHPSKAHPSEPHPSEPHPSKPHPSEPHPSEPHPSKAHPSEPHPNKTHLSEPHPSEPHPRKSHPSEPHPSEPHPSEPHPSKAPWLRPLSGQGEHPVGLQGPPPWGAAPQDELDNLDNELFLAACRELEGPVVATGHGQKPPRKENTQECVIPKKLRVGEELAPLSGGSQDRQGPLPSPKLVLRPSTAGVCAPRPLPSLGEPGGSVPAPGAPSLAGSSPSVPWTPPAQRCPPPRLPPRPPKPHLQQPPGPPNPPNAPGPPTPPVVTNHLVQLVTAASKAPRSRTRVPLGRESRRFPGPAGILPQQHSGKLLEEILVSAPQTPAHGAVAKPRAQPQGSVTEDFGRGPWLAMKTELGLDERDPSCFLHTYSVVMVLRKAALKQLPKNKVPSMAVMIKALTRSSAGAGAVFRDPTGEMQGTVHRLLLEQRQSELRAGAVLLLRQVGVFSPSHRNHYLNVTPTNLLRIFPPEPEGCSPRQVRGDAAAVPQSPPTHTKLTDPIPADDLDGLLEELPEDFFSAPARAEPSSCC